MNFITSSKDEFFKENFNKSFDFQFTEKVATVFDDMVHRSVPFYNEIQRMIGELAFNNYQDNSNVYDLGCSTGTTLIEMNKHIPDHIHFVGVDDSSEMLKKCKNKLSETGIVRPISLKVADLNCSVDIQNASVVVLCLTLQFVRPLNRERLLRQIVSGMNSGGVIILIEKILAEDSTFNRDFIKYYYDMKKRHNYSEMEIAQKREALENVLIPYKLSENVALVTNAGCSHAEVFFKWYNFSGIIAKK